MKTNRKINRREFMGTAALAAASVTLVPRQVLGGTGFTAPSDRITMACIGCGTQGQREMLNMVNDPGIQILAVCDPVSEGSNYVDWSRNSLRNKIRQALGNQSWGAHMKGIRGGREVAGEIIRSVYAGELNSVKYSGINTYEDFRDLLEREKDLDAVMITTPDHLLATISIAAMKKGKHVISHKPLSNRVSEVRLVADTTKKAGVVSHNLAWRPEDNSLLQKIENGEIGTLRELHLWTDGPYWPQYKNLPGKKPPVPEGFNWDLWLGPVPEVSYHSHYAHGVYRGWYEFGSGSIGEKGNKYLWKIFNTLDLGIPAEIEALPGYYNRLHKKISRKLSNDFSFPDSSIVRFKLPALGNKSMVNLFWYDGGLRPMVPAIYSNSTLHIPGRGILIVGDNGFILNGQTYSKNQTPQQTGLSDDPPDKTLKKGNRENYWVKAVKSGKPAPGNFIDAGKVSETICLGAVALRYARKNTGKDYVQVLKWDADNMKFLNAPEAVPMLSREYRAGWELKALS